MTEEEKRILIERARLFLEQLGFVITKTEMFEDKIKIEAERKIKEEKKE